MSTNVYVFFGPKAKPNPSKKKKKGQQPAFVPRPLRPTLPATARISDNTRSHQSIQFTGYQAPHHEQESMVELSDDTSPNTPLATTSVGWKPLGSGPAGANDTTPVKRKPAEIKVTPTRQEKWLKFKEGLEKQNIHKIGVHKPQNEQDESTNQNPTSDQMKTNKTEQNDTGEPDIKWELNTLDDNGEPIQDIPKPDPPKPEVVQGTASQIKLFQSKPTEKPKIAVGTTKTSQPVNHPGKLPGQTFVHVGGNTWKAIDPPKPKVKAKSLKAIPKSSAPPRPPAPIPTLIEREIRRQCEPTNKVPTTNLAPHLEHDLSATNVPMNYPKGVPRSFQQSSIGAIVPQDIPHYGAQMPIFDLEQPGRSRFDQGPNYNPTGPNQGPRFDIGPGHMNRNPEGLQVNTGLVNETTEEVMQYSPSDVYDFGSHALQDREGSVSSDGHGQKRLSAFQRLGPQSQPKKSKLTINLLCNKDVREVLDNGKEEEVEKFTPVHLRKEIINSNNEVVMKYLPHWPWRKNVPVIKSATFRNSKTVMMLEQERMEEVYDKEQTFMKVSVRGYPQHWKKEDVLDAILDEVKGKSFIPCFTEMTQEECKFLVIRCRSGLLRIHKLGFVIRKEDVELQITISETGVTLSHVNFVPRLVLRKLLSCGYDGERKLSLSEFTSKFDISHFIYFPLNRVCNQIELIELQSTIAWDYITDLDLSHNRITSLEGFALPKTTPRLKNLDLSYNSLDRVTILLRIREISLRSIKLEGNPFCRDYTDPAQYVKVIKMIFPTVIEIDGVEIQLKGDFPKPKKNFCISEDAHPIANKFLETFFPLLEAPCAERSRIEDMYDEKAVLTVTYRYSMRYSSLHRKFRDIFLRARVFAEGDTEAIDGAANITRLIAKWPPMLHDSHTFTTDVLLHNENSTILRIGGVLKLIPETLAEDEYLLAFTRTVVLMTNDGIEYKIMNEMIYWDEPCKELANAAFHLNTIRNSKRVSLKLDCNPDEELKEKLVEIFVKLTNLEKKMSTRCLELKEWNIRTALEHYLKLVKLDDLESLKCVSKD